MNVQYIIPIVYVINSYIFSLIKIIDQNKSRILFDYPTFVIWERVDFMPTVDYKDLLFKPIEEIGKLYRCKDVSPVEVTQATLDLQAELEPKLNTFITVMAEKALQQAREAENTFMKGDPVGKLYGIPISIKDIFMTKGIKTTMGSRIFNNYIPEVNSYLFSSLKNAGAIIFGKTNMLEFAYGCVHPDYGQCNNPWDTNRTAGGSSTGSASSVAAGIGFASIGTDTGGSIRLPSSFCGVVGLKPTYDRISRQGLFPLSQSLDHIGPITRTVRDNAIILESILQNQENFVFDANDRSISGIKIGVIRTLTDLVSHPEVNLLFNSAIKKLFELGAEVIEVEIPGIDTAVDIAFPILLSEGSYNHKEWCDSKEGDYAKGTIINIKEGFKVSAVSYLEALKRKRILTEKLDSIFDSFDILVCPTAPCAATEKDPSFDDPTYNFTQRTIPFNITGNPAITVSAGLTSSNLPVGIQFIGRHFDEATIYQLADTFQSATGGYQSPNI